MCGRFVQAFSAEDLQDKYKASNQVVIKPNYNVSPHTNIVTILKSQETNQLEMHTMLWGLVPFWSDDTKIGNKLINARAETINEKPAFKKSFKTKRCIIPATGFYEWQDETRQPYFIKPKDGMSNIFSFAGIWDKWQDQEGNTLITCAIITKDASPALKFIHNRMPVIIPDQKIKNWLDPDATPDSLNNQLHSPQNVGVEYWEVDRKVNNPINYEPGLIAKHT